MTDAIVEELEKNIKLVMDEYRLDRDTFTFISGLRFIADASPELTEELIPEVFTAYIEVERELPAQALAAASPPNGPVADRHAENIERPVEHLGPVLATAVIVRTILATPNLTAQNFLDALKKLNLVPEGLDDTLRQRIDRMLQIRNELHSHVHIPVSKREGLIFEECRNRISVRLNQRLRKALEAEHERRAAQRPTPGFAARAASKAPRTEGIPAATLRRINQVIPDSKERDEALAEVARNAELSRRTNHRKKLEGQASA